MTTRMEQWATRDDVREMSRDILTHIDRRLNERDRVGEQRHGENADRLDVILEQCRETNGRVSKLEALYQRLDQEFQGIRKRWHEFRESIQKIVSTRAAVSSDERSLTRRELGWIFTLIVTCFWFGWVANQFIKGGP
jgi:predicted nuclease with TOPRIM domain